MSEGTPMRIFARGGQTTLHSRPSDEAALTATAEIAERYGVSMRDETLDLLALTFGCELSMIERFIAAVSERQGQLDAFKDFSRQYAHEIVEGVFAADVDQIVQSVLPDERISKTASVLHGLTFADRFLTASEWAEAIGLDRETTSVLLDRFLAAGIFEKRASSYRVSLSGEFSRDLLRSSSERYASLDSPKLTIARTVIEVGSRAVSQMARYYVERDAIGLDEIISEFDGRDVPAVFFNEGNYAETFKGVADKDVLSKLAAAQNTLFRLPNIYTAAFTSDVYPPLLKVIPRRLSAIGLGFEGSPGPDSKVAWVAAEIGSKDEVDSAAAEFWCDRLEMAAVMAGFAKTRIWLVGRNGFTVEARSRLTEREALFSSRNQTLLLRRFRNETLGNTRAPDADDFEITLSMDDRSELIAASLVEDIAKKHNFDARSINQIKTAVIEAFINATEHSLSPDRKVRQRFSVDENGLTVTISNRGIRLDQRQRGTIDPDQRRGWGLELMRRLMDDVTILETDDGTSISMTKHLVSA